MSVMRMTGARASCSQRNEKRYVLNLFGEDFSRTMSEDRPNERFLMRMPQLSSLKTFEVAARHESFARAAQELHVTHGAISKQIRALEEELGEPLFERRNRAVFLTERGRQLSRRLSAAFLDQENAMSDFRTRRWDQPLVVSCEPTLCLKLLIPKLPDLKAKTGLNVRVLAAGGSIDFRRDHIDLAIRRNDFPISPDIQVRKLAPEAMGLVCSPAIAGAIAASPHYESVALHTRSRPDAWTRWKKGRRTEFKFASDAVYEHFYLAIEAALAGQGVALVSIHMVAAELASGRLHALTPFEPDGTEYVALTQKDWEQNARSAQFAEWLTSTMTESASDRRAAAPSGPT